MLEITLSEFVPLTAGDAFHQLNRLQFWLRGKITFILKFNR